MNMDNVLRELEHAATVLLSGPHEVTNTQRRHADHTFQAFKRSPNPFECCIFLLENSSLDYVKYQAVCTIKEATVRLWPSLKGERGSQLRTFLMNYVVQKHNLVNYLKEQLMQTVAVISKLSCFESYSLGETMQELSKLQWEARSKESVEMKMLYLSLIEALLYEFSGGVKSSSIGLSWEYHHKCKVLFEERYMLSIYQLLIRDLSLFCDGTVSQKEKPLLLKVLSLLYSIYSWNFIHDKLPYTLVGKFAQMEATVFKPPSDWAEEVFNGNCVGMLYKVHALNRNHSDLLALQCLVQLAALSGPTINDEAPMLAYMAETIRHLAAFRTESIHVHEIVSLSSIVFNMITTHPTPLFEKLEETVLKSFIETIAALIMASARSAAQEEAAQEEDKVFEESFEKLLDAWCRLRFKFELLLKGTPSVAELIRQYCLSVFMTYLQCHLFPSDGIRSTTANGMVCTDDDEEYEELDEDDRDRFHDVLMWIGMCGRVDVIQSLNITAKLMEDRVALLVKSVQQMASNQPVTAYRQIHEDLHWLLLISINLLCEPNEDDRALIPEDLFDYASSDAVGDEISVQYILSLGSSQSPANDHIARLLVAVLRLCQIENDAFQAGFVHLLSPQVGSSLMFWLSEFASAYVMPREADYWKLSVRLILLFGGDSTLAPWLIEFCVAKIGSNLAVWLTEEKVLQDTARLLLTLTQNRDRSTALFNMASFLTIAEKVATNVPPVATMPSGARKMLAEAVVLVTSAKADSERKEQFWNMIFSNFSQKLDAIIGQEELVAQRYTERVISEVCAAFEGFIGFSKASRLFNAQMLFTHLLPRFEQSVKILDIYHDYSEVVELVLELYLSTSEHLIRFFDHTELEQLFQSTLAMLQVYAKHSQGRNGLNVEEEQHEDVRLLLQILSKYAGEAILRDDVATGGNATDVVVCGLHILVPIMTLELLQFPDLCTEYYSLLNLLGQLSPKKLCLNLYNETFVALVESVRIGLTQFTSEVAGFCLDTIHSIAIFTSSQETVVDHLIKAVHLFLENLLTNLVSDNFDMDLLISASLAFQALVACDQRFYEEQVNRLLAKQGDAQGQQLLLAAFNEFSPSDFAVNSISAAKTKTKISFSQKFEQFLIQIRRVMCTK